MLLVTGGYYNDDRLDSTELLVPGSGSWRLAAGLLPRPVDGVRVATLANTLARLLFIIICILFPELQNNAWGESWVSNVMLCVHLVT